MVKDQATCAGLLHVIKLPGLGTLCPQLLLSSSSSSSFSSSSSSRRGGGSGGGIGGVGGEESGAVRLYLIRHRRRRISIQPVEFDPDATEVDGDNNSSSSKSSASSLLCGQPKQTTGASYTY